LHAEWLPWSLFALGMFLVWSVVCARSGSFRKSTIAALVLGISFESGYNDILAHTDDETAKGG